MFRSAASAIRAPAGASPEPRRSTCTPTGRPCMSRTIPLPSETTSEVPYPLSKRLFDRAVAVALIVLLSPLLVLSLVVIGLDMLLVPRDRGRLLYRERRISRGKEFDVLKFRVLRENVL